jgi:methylmalonyl-CoA epimerase
MKLNHIGIVVSNIQKEAQFYQGMGFSTSGLIINQTQKVKEIFVEQNKYTTIELIEPLNEQSPVFAFLQKGGGVHHFCYELDENIDSFINKQRIQGAIIICHPVYDIAFDRKIAFLYKSGKIFEVVEALKFKTKND